MGLKERYEKLYSGIVYDAMCFDIKYPQPFVLNEKIKPVWKLPHNKVLFGHAFTCKGQLVFDEKGINDTVRIEMFKYFTEGCIQVIDTGRDDTVAHFGDISGKIAKKFGCSGAVIDGNTRDIKYIEEDQFLLFCRNIQPVDAYGKWQIIEYQTTVLMSGINGEVAVSPNDYIFGDPDGVIVIPEHLGEKVCELAEIRLKKENKVRQQLKETSDMQKMYDEIGRW